MTELANAEARPTEARLLHMVFPDHTNHLGTLFGGQALAWMDMASFIAASRYARTTVVTARSEQVDFNQPIHKGDLVEVVAQLVKVGRSSMSVDVEVITGVERQRWADEDTRRGPKAASPWQPPPSGACTPHRRGASSTLTHLEQSAAEFSGAAIDFLGLFHDEPVAEPEM